jgi:hypothetical protein
VHRAPVKEPAQRAPEWSAPDASGAGGLRHEKAAGPVWIRSRSSGPDLASSDRAHRPDPREGVDLARERGRPSPSQAPDEPAAITLDQPPGGARTAPGWAPDRSPRSFAGPRADCGVRAAPPFRSAGTHPEGCGADRPERRVLQRMARQPVPADRPKRREPLRLCRRRRTTNGREPERGPRIRRINALYPFTAAAACPDPHGSVRNRGGTDGAENTLAPNPTLSRAGGSFRRNDAGSNPLLRPCREIPVHSSRRIAQMPHSFSTRLSTSAAWRPFPASD